MLSHPHHGGRVITIWDDCVTVAIIQTVKLLHCNYDVRSLVCRWVVTRDGGCGLELLHSNVTSILLLTTPANTGLQHHYTENTFISAYQFRELTF